MKLSTNSNIQDDLTFVVKQFKCQHDHMFSPNHIYLFELGLKIGGMMDLPILGLSAS